LHNKELSGEAELDLSGAPAASRSRSPLMAIVVLMGLVAAAYFGWTQLHKPIASTTPTAGPLQPPSPDFGAADVNSRGACSATGGASSSTGSRYAGGTRESLLSAKQDRQRIRTATKSLRIK